MSGENGEWRNHNAIPMINSEKVKLKKHDILPFGGNLGPYWPWTQMRGSPCQSQHDGKKG